MIILTERYYFFNSGVGDPRVYEASHFAEYFGSVLSTGLLHTDEVPGMEVSVETGTLNTIVSAGKAIMKGRFYENTAPLTLTHDIPEVTLDRIDRIILRLNLSNAERNIKLMVLSGASSATPVAPALVRDNFIYDISLAQILVRANTVQLLPGDLIDERLDENLAGLVYSLISIPTSQFQAEWDAFMAGIVDSGFATVESVDAVSDALTTHTADDTAHEIGDKTNLLTTDKTTIVSAMNELFTNANNGKTDIASVIGSPATAGDTFTQLKTHIQNSKDELATNLTSKGQSSTGAEALAILITKIQNINTGKGFASGTVTSTALTNRTHRHFNRQNSTVNTATQGFFVSLSNLGFTPSIIIAHRPAVGFTDFSFAFSGNLINNFLGGYPLQGISDGYSMGFAPTALFGSGNVSWLPVSHASQVYTYYIWE